MKIDKEKHDTFVEDMNYFLKKNSLISLQQAQILLNAEVGRRYMEEASARNPLFMGLNKETK